MANYYTRFSFLVRVDGEPDWLSELQAFVVDPANTELEHPISLDGVVPFGLPQVEVDERGVWFHDDAGGSDLDVTIRLVQWVLGHVGTPETVGFQWAETCSSARIDAFGGGAALVGRINYTSTSTRSRGLWDQLAAELGDADDADD